MSVTSISTKCDFTSRKQCTCRNCEANPICSNVWCIIDCCYDECDIEGTSGENMSEATSERINHGRRIGAKVDLLLTTEVQNLMQGKRLHNHADMESPLALYF
ncbi:hypothetical protein VTP01DRAFT_506 [Rhizomucor pusillus]|uniref:uncharacterized protein n=1 Tax=Rhizomucor pusillus TaxID=4840 RepID=UPI003742993E